MITVEDLIYTYPGAPEPTVRGISFEIADGEIFQVVLSTRFSVDVALPPFELYRSLRAGEAST